MENRINIRLDVRSSLSFVVFSVVIIATAFFLLAKIKTATEEFERLNNYPQYQMLQEELRGGASAVTNSFPTISAEWKTYRSQKYGFEVKYPREFSFEDKGELNPAGALLYNHWLTVTAKGSQYDEYLAVFIYNGARYDFDNFRLFPADSASKKITIGNKRVSQSSHQGADGETQNIYWIDTIYNRSVIFSVNPAHAMNLQEFYAVIDSFRFLK